MRSERLFQFNRSVFETRLSRPEYHYLNVQATIPILVIQPIFLATEDFSMEMRISIRAKLPMILKKSFHNGNPELGYSNYNYKINISNLI